MSAQVNTFLTALAAVAASAILALALAESADTAVLQNPAPQAIVKLERVVVVGKAVRAADEAAAVAARRIEKLPRVVVTGHRADAATQLALAPACTVEVGC